MRWNDAYAEEWKFQLPESGKARVGKRAFFPAGLDFDLSVEASPDAKPFAIFVKS